MNDVMPDPESPVTDNTSQENQKKLTRGGRFVQRIGFTLMGVACLMIFYGAIAFYAWGEGEQERVAQMQAELDQDLARQIELASEDIGERRYELAIKRTEFILETDPDNAQAIAMQNEASTQLAILLTPSPSATPTSTPAPPTATPGPTLTPTIDVSNLAGELDEINEHVRNQEWQTAVGKLEAFRGAHPDYEPLETARLLYDSYVGLGLRLTRSDKSQIERGLFYLAQAKMLGDLSEEVAGEVFWAEQYLEGIVYYDINWNAYLSYFRPLCQFAPLFQNSCGLLAEGLLAQGEQYTSVLDWCPAVDVYNEASPHLNKIDGDRTAVEEYGLRVNTARNRCAQATSTPNPFSSVITNTFPIATPSTSGNSFVATPIPTPVSSSQSQGAIPAGLTTDD